MAYKNVEEGRLKARTRSKKYYAANKNNPIRWCHSLKGRFGTLLHSAHDRGIEVGINLAEYSKIVQAEACFYCKNELPKMGGGVDRKNSSGGYSVENCVPCCTNCNKIRGKDLISHSEMIEVANLLKRLRGKS